MPKSDEKRDFMKLAEIIVDSREKANSHITEVFDNLGVMWRVQKLDMGDYSFTVNGTDFTRSCVIERKADVDELYGNVTGDRERIEKELDGLARNVRQIALLIENCSGWEHLRGYEIPESIADKQGRKVRNIGATVYSTLQSWRCGNRYGFSVEFVPDTRRTAQKILEIFYWYWHNYRIQTAPRR